MLKQQEATSAPIFEHLHKQIISMQIYPGQKLSENGLAKQFSISRTPVREAIARLANIGLVEVKMKSGTFVTLLSTKKITEAQFIRQAIESAIVQKVAADVPLITIANCEYILSQQEKAAIYNDAFQFQQLDDQFHQALADYTKYDRAANIVQIEKAHLDRVRNLGLKEVGNQYTRVLEQHRRILEAIKQGDPEQAKLAMCEHTGEILTILDEIKANHSDYFE